MHCPHHPLRGAYFASFSYEEAEAQGVKTKGTIPPLGGGRASSRTQALVSRPRCGLQDSAGLLSRAEVLVLFLPESSPHPLPRTRRRRPLCSRQLRAVAPWAGVSRSRVLRGGDERGLLRASGHVPTLNSASATGAPPGAAAYGSTPGWRAFTRASQAPSGWG